MEEKKPRGRAAILAIGTANPADVIRQDSYPDLYFEATDKKNKTGLKEKFKRICDRTMITKRHTHLTRDLLNNKSMLTYGAPSLNARQDILISRVPELGEKAASVAIREWGGDKLKITHLMFHSTSGVHMPGADCRIIELLDLPPSVKRTMLYHQGSYVSGTLLRMAKDTAENNHNARILVVCSEIALGSFHGPCEADLGSLLAQAIMGDGAAALIIGAEPNESVETPLFELMSASQMIVPHSANAIEGSLSEMGLTFRISRTVPDLISAQTEGFLRELLEPYGMGGDWKSFFWAIHTGGRAILDRIQETLGLNDSNLEATRHVLSEYGNVGSASVFFVLNEIRERGAQGEGTSSAAGGGTMDWGILFAFGAGLTLDAVLLRRFP